MHGQSRVDTKEGADAGIAASQFQGHKSGGYRTQARTTIALNVGYSEAQGSQLGNKFKGELGMLPVVVDNWNDLFVREVAHFIAYAAFLLG